ELKATSGQWMQASPSSSSAGSLRGAAVGASALPSGGVGGYRRRSLQGGSPPVVVSPILSAPNSVPATPQHGSRLPPGATVLPTPVLPAQLQAAATNPEHIPRKFLAAQAYYRLQQQQPNNGGPSAVSDIHSHVNNITSAGCNVEGGRVASTGVEGEAEGDAATTTAVDVVVYDDVSLPPRAPSSTSIGPCDPALNHLNHNVNRNFLTQPELDVPSAPLKFGPGFDSPSQRQVPPPSRSRSPRTPRRGSPAPRSASAQSSSPSPSPSPSLNGVPPRWAPIGRPPLNNNNLTKGLTAIKTSSLSSLSSDASLSLASVGGGFSTPHHLPLGTTTQQTKHNSLNNSQNAAAKGTIPPAKPKRFDERAIYCNVVGSGGVGTGSANNKNNNNNNNVVSVGSKIRPGSDHQHSAGGAGEVLAPTESKSQRTLAGLSSAAFVDAGGVIGEPQAHQQPLFSQPVPLSWRGQREGALSPLQLVDGHAGPASPQLGQTKHRSLGQQQGQIQQQQAKLRQYSSPFGGHALDLNDSSSSGRGGVSSYLEAAATGQRANSPANSDASSKNDESVIFRRVTIKKKVDSSSSTGSSDTQPQKRISVSRGSVGLQGDTHDGECLKANFEETSYRF
ncbi:hypothetical protein BIW11_10926, partial [Tropilaelaps mercedesae]